MSEYAYIPLIFASDFLALYKEDVPIYTPSHMPGVDPCLADSNGQPMPNVLLMEAEAFTEALTDLIENTFDGMVFGSAHAYQAHIAVLAEEYAQEEELEDAEDTQEPEAAGAFDVLIDEVDTQAEDSADEERDDVGTAPNPEIDVPVDAEQPPADSPESDPHETD